MRPRKMIEAGKIDELAAEPERFLKIGQLVKIALLIDNEASQQGLAVDGLVREHKSLLEDMTLKHLEVAWPTEGGALLPVEIGQRMALRVPYGLGVLQLIAKVVGTSRARIPLLLIDREGEWSRIQLRSHARVDIDIVPHETRVFRPGELPLQANIRDTADATIDQLKKGAIPGEALGATIANLSAGGMLLRSRRRVTRGNIVQIKFSLDGMNVQIDALGGVVWAEENLLKKLYAWRVGCQFIDLSNKEQDLIAKFVFAKQTELRRYRLMWRE